MNYNWQQPDWPNFRYELADMESDLLAFVEKVGLVSGLVKGLTKEDQTEAVIQVMISEALKTSEIEGEYLSHQDVKSSIRNQLGLNDSQERVRDRASEGAGELMVAVRNSWDHPLSAETLFSWHRMLMKGTSRIATGAWRTHETPMQVISNPYGKLKVHFEAPASRQVLGEMKQFVNWYNESLRNVMHAPVRSAIAHLYFESIHPFEDGNGRIGRAVSEKALSLGMGRPAIISLSAVIESNKKSYYGALEKAQMSNEITDWIAYFVSVVLEAQCQTEKWIEFILRKKQFFEAHQSLLNERQLLVIRRMLKEGPDGFEGGMNARKYISLTGVSKATATRDLQDLSNKGVFVPVGGGRSARYELKL
jgi:Fic family protein